MSDRSRKSGNGVAACLLALAASMITSNNSVRLTWIGGSNAWQYLECSPNLASNQWLAIFTNTPPMSITNSATLTGATASNLFFRINATANT